MIAYTPADRLNPPRTRLHKESTFVLLIMRLNRERTSSRRTSGVCATLIPPRGVTRSRLRRRTDRPSNPDDPPIPAQRSIARCRDRVEIHGKTVIPKLAVGTARADRISDPRRIWTRTRGCVGAALGTFLHFLPVHRSNRRGAIVRAIGRRTWFLACRCDPRTKVRCRRVVRGCVWIRQT